MVVVADGIEATPTLVSRKDTSRFIPSRFPPVGILDTISDPYDLQYIIELENWTNDRLSSELGLIMTIPAAEWVVGVPNATAVMAAYCHPHAEGGRFNSNTRGAWYAGLSLDTAIQETIFHRTKELEEIGVFETRVEMRQYLADFECEFHDVRASPTYDELHDPNSYKAGQALGDTLLQSGSNGVFYRSVRHTGGECIGCFRPKLVLNVRPAAHFEYKWEGGRVPKVRVLSV
jgi:hypothetical protein